MGTLLYPRGEAQKRRSRKNSGIDLRTKEDDKRKLLKASLDGPTHVLLAHHARMERMGGNIINTVWALAPPSCIRTESATTRLTSILILRGREDDNCVAVDCGSPRRQVRVNK